MDEYDTTDWSFCNECQERIEKDEGGGYCQKCVSEKFVNRKELVEEILASAFQYPVECRQAMEVAFTKIVKIIDTHGLKAKEEE